MSKEKVAFLTASTWGTAFSVIAAEKTNPMLYFHSEDGFRSFQRTHQNTKYLPGITLPDNVLGTNSLREALYGARVVVMVVPPEYYRGLWRQAKPFIEEDADVLSLSKGLEARTHSRMTQILSEKDPVFVPRVAVLGGPNLANEVVNPSLLSGADIASFNPELSLRLKKMFEIDRFKINVSDDVAGVEFGGALKNVIAIFIGMVDGLRKGYNSRGVLMSYGLAEIRRLGIACGANPDTFTGFSGLGDLEASCSPASRNYTSGFEIVQGVLPREILHSKKRVEGFYTVIEAVALAKKAQVQVPIMDLVYQIIYKGLNPAEGIKQLMKLEFCN